MMTVNVWGCVLSDAMHLSPTQTGSMSVHGECGHEQLMRVAPHFHMCKRCCLRSYPTVECLAAPLVLPESLGKVAVVGSLRFSRFVDSLYRHHSRSGRLM